MSTSAKAVAAPGTEMFARFAYAPNRLGYCGPAETSALRTGSADRVRDAARHFTGAWPYLRVMSRMTGIADPLDRRLVESYWLGGGVGAELDPAAFVTELLAVIGPAAGNYWQYLTRDCLAGEAAANHCFHVFGIYPWSRLLGRGGEQPIRVLDCCRIGWGTVSARAGDELTVRCRRLRFDGGRLLLGVPEPVSVPVWEDGFAAVPDAAPGQLVALHWDRLCGPLTLSEARTLAVTTARQLRVTNRRLAR
ncbi:DUF6390 family protein [Nocardia jinanensis]|uniref:Uncharacterized protein n=1 Tax=Nocardia jinanensis TaxID=382504 RepID=A0A917RW83_9NOCA|nr:DUF6390 family protein [Nocardia jinanensis]GGL39512.1 hypothetical protein GCM10011588_62860 [Nocardia jinanensis]